MRQNACGLQFVLYNATTAWLSDFREIAMMLYKSRGQKVEAGRRSWAAFKSNAATPTELLSTAAFSLANDRVPMARAKSARYEVATVTCHTASGPGAPEFVAFDNVAAVYSTTCAGTMRL